MPSSGLDAGAGVDCGVPGGAAVGALAVPVLVLLLLGALPWTLGDPLLVGFGEADDDDDAPDGRVEDVCPEVLGVERLFSFAVEVELRCRSSVE